MQTQELKKRSWISREYPSTWDGVTEFYSIVIAVALTAVVVALISLIPVDTDTSKYADTIILSILTECKPEPLEMISYAAAVVTLPLTYLAAYYYFSAHKKRLPLPANYIAGFIAVAAVAVVSVAAFIATNDTSAFMNAKTSTTYFQSLFMPSFFFIIPVTAVFMSVIAIGKYLRGGFAGKAVFLVVLGLIIVYSFYRIVMIKYSVQLSAYNTHHYYACWYPIAKVEAGQTIGVDFRSIYGFYPYLVIPILKLFGGVNQQSSSIFIAVLLTLVALGYCSFTYRFIKNKILGCIIAAICCLYGPFSILGDTANGGTREYLQYNPMRSIFVSFTLFAVVIHSSLKSKRASTILNIVMCVVYGLGIFSNFESGVIATLIWAAYNVYVAASKESLFSMTTFRVACLSLISAAVSVAIYVGLVLSVTYLRSGELLSLHEVFFGISVFAGTGFNMIPLSFSLWVIFAIVFAAGLFIVLPYITRFKTVDENFKDTLNALFVISVTGIGAFSYFIGRSYSTNALLFLPYAVICCGFMCDYHFAQAELNKENGLNAVSVIRWGRIVLCCVLISEAMLPSVVNLANSFSEEFAECHYPSQEKAKECYADSEYIREWAEKNNGGVIPNLLTSMSVFDNEWLGRTPAETVCEQIDWFYSEDAYTYIMFINQHKDESFVINNKAVEVLEYFYKADWDKAVSGYEENDKFTAGDYTLTFYKPKR